MVLRLLIVAQAAVAATSLANEFLGFCSECVEARSWMVAAAGTGFYAVLAVMIWRRKAEAWIVPLLLVGLGVHSALAADLFHTGRICKLCIAAATGSLLLAVAALAPRPRLAWTLVFFWPLGAAAAAAALPFVSDLEPPQHTTYGDPPIVLTKDSGEIVVFVLYGCGACERFHREREPELVKLYVEPGIARLRTVPVMVKTETPAIRRAHQAAYAAEKQGKGNEVVGRLTERFAEWNAPGADPITALGDLVDLQRLLADMETAEVKDRVEAVKAWARQVGAHRMPSIWVQGRGSTSGRILDHSLAWDRLTRAIDLELGHAP